MGIKNRILDVNGSVASRKINEKIDRAINDLAYCRKKHRAKNGVLKIELSYPAGPYVRPLQEIAVGMPLVGHEETLRYREIKFTITAKIV